MTKTAAKVIEDFQEHKAAKLAARAAGVNGTQTRINFKKFFDKLRVRNDRNKAAKAAKAAKVLKKL